MSSKLDFLKRYEDRGTINKRKGKRKKSNFYVVDDDVNWKSTLIHAKSELKCEEDSDEAPLVAEVRDESVLKWQPLSIPEEKTSAIQDTAKKRKKHEGKSKPSTIGISETYDSDLSPPRDSRGVMEDCGSLKNDHQDLSPPRKAQKVVDNTLPFDDLSPPRRVCNSKNTYGHPRTDEAELELKDYRSRKQDNHSERYLKGCNATGKHSHHKERKISIDHNRAQEDQEDHAEKKKNDEEFMQWGRGYVVSSGPWVHRTFSLKPGSYSMCDLVIPSTIASCKIHKHHGVFTECHRVLIVTK